MKKILKTIAEFLVVMTAIVFFINIASLDVIAADNAALPLTPGAESVYQSGNIMFPPAESGQEILKKVVLGGFAYAKVIIGVIGIMFIIILGMQLVFAMGKEEDVTKAKRGLTYAIVAFVMVSMGADIAKIFDMQEGTILESPQEILKRVHLFDKQVEIFMTFVKYVIGTYATLMLVYSGGKLISSGGNEEEVTKHRKGAMYSAAGLLLIYVGEIFIEKVFYKIDKDIYTGISGVHPGLDAKEGVEQITGITNMIIKFVGPVAVLMLIAGAIMYATAGGEDERMQKAKRVLLATVVGIVIIYGAFALISTVISSRLSEIGIIN